jgi:hypothetical protein
MAGHRIFSMKVAGVYPAYLAKAAKKGRSKDEVDAVFRWLTGHDQASLDATLAAGTTFEDFFVQAPAMNPARSLVTGTVCGVRVETIEDPTMREIRILDKMIDELAKGRPLDKILRA